MIKREENAIQKIRKNRFILDNDEVHTIIPGMRKVKNVEANIAASDGKKLDKSIMRKLKDHRWDRTPTAWSQ